MDTNQKSLVVYVDIDDTLIRSVGTKRIPIPATIQHVRELSEQGAELYCWSSGGADYARASAKELGIHSCFPPFFPNRKCSWMIRHPASGDGPFSFIPQKRTGRRSRITSD